MLETEKQDPGQTAVHLADITPENFHEKWSEFLDTLIREELKKPIDRLVAENSEDFSNNNLWEKVRYFLYSIEHTNTFLFLS